MYFIIFYNIIKQSLSVFFLPPTISKAIVRLAVSEDISLGH